MCLQIYDAAKAVMNSSLQPTIEKLNTAKESATQQASTLKEISIAKANELLNTQCGNMAVQGIDNTSVLINRLLDHYFPAVEEGEENAPSMFSVSQTFFALYTNNVLNDDYQVQYQQMKIKCFMRYKQSVNCRQKLLIAFIIPLLRS